MKSLLRMKILPFLVVCLGVLYGVWPVDVIPDIPIIGWVDDVGVLGTTVLIALSLYLKNKKRERKD